MNCKYCAAPIPEGEHLCPACGKSQLLEEALSPMEETPTEEVDGEDIIPDAAPTLEEGPALAALDENGEKAALEGDFTEEVTVEEIVAESIIEVEKTNLEKNSEVFQGTKEEDTAPASQEKEPQRKGKKALWAAVAVIIIAALAAGAYFLTKGAPGEAAVPGENRTRTMVSYSTGRELKTTVGSQQQPVSFFINDAYTLSNYSSIEQLMEQSPIYIGYQNYAELENEVVYVDTVIQSANSTAGQAASHGLYSIAHGGQPALLDSNIQSIQASGKDFVYYNKVEDNQIIQYRYANGEINNVNQELGVDHAVITTCSQDGKVFGFRGAKNSGDGTMASVNGYMADGAVHFLEPTAAVYYVSQDGGMIYITDTAKSPAPSLSYVSDIASGTLEEISPYITEFIFYEDTGSVAYIGGREIGENEINPSCNLGYFDASSKTHHIITQDAVALVEADAKSYAWLNENTKEMFVTELSQKISVPSAAKAGQFHYINAAGDFMAADIEGNTFTIATGFYSPEGYTLSVDLYYPSYQNGAFLWNNGDTVYKYTAGSMAASQTITLDSPLSEKLSGALQVGYFMDGSGNLIEQTENTLVKKSFENSDVLSIYDSPSAFIIVGLNPTGDSIYFISGDSTLYEKSLKDTSNPKPVASQVHSAVAVADGLYVLREFGINGSGGRLEFQGWGKKGFSLVENNVVSLTDVVVG